ncbi:potassium channel family protein [Fundicoccus ignavus]|uniref:TrkA family potassium uptake protein n=1 Tax=Fundicoccus ignavus TaxID=2664442 RepID=A0A844CFV5_9LACT|nr:TrkA family potassium uptake protein [Fundicoccus ignavus]MRJ48491.1 TrkA family potassium uptake protein [Fundicoccus ignavus]
MNNKTVGVLGLGVFGRTVARELSRYGCDVIAIDSDATNVDAVSDEVTYAAIGDFTDLDLLKSVGLGNCDIVVVATGTNLESSVLAVMHSKKLGIQQIIAKARSMTYEEVLYEVGVDAVVAPERDSGMRLASKILRNNIDEVLRLDDDTSIIEFETPDKWVGQTLISLDLRRKFDLNLLGMREERGEPLTPLEIDKPLMADTILVAMAASHVFEASDYLGHFK